MRTIVKIKAGKFGDAFDRMFKFIEESDVFEMRMLGRGKFPHEKKIRELVLRFPPRPPLKVRYALRNPEKH